MVPTLRVRSSDLSRPVNRLEHGKDNAVSDRYRRIVGGMGEQADLFVELGLDRHESRVNRYARTVSGFPFSGEEAERIPNPGVKGANRIHAPSLRDQLPRELHLFIPQQATLFF